MARVERFTSQEQIPVQQAQLIDPRSFPADISSAEALKVAGGVLEELGKRKLVADDSLAINAAGESRDLAKLQMRQFMLNNPDPDKWPEGMTKILQDQGKIYNEQRFSAKVKANEDIEQEAFINELEAETWLAITTQTIQNDITVSGKNLIDKIANDDGSSTAAADIQKQVELYQAALERKDTKEIADIKMEETLGEAEKQRISVLTNQGRFEEARKLAQKTKSLTPPERNAQLAIIDRAKARALKVADEAKREDKLALYAKEDLPAKLAEDFKAGGITARQYKEQLDSAVLTRDDFNNAWLDPEEADQHYDEYVSGLAAEQRGEVNFIKKGDPIIIARTEAIIDLNPMAITEEQLYELSTRGVGTENITSMVDRLRKAKKGFYAPITKYNTQFSTLLNAEYFGDKDEIETSTRYLEMKRKMREFIDSQKPTEVLGDAFFKGLITKNFTGFGRGGWEEKGFEHTYIGVAGTEVTQRFRFGDIRVRKVGKKTISEFYAGTDDDGDALWLPRR